MSQLLRSATPMPVVPRQPGGAIVRAASPGGLVHSPGGAVTPWMQRIKTGATAGRILAAPAVAAVAGPAAGLSIGLGLGGAILGSMGRPGTARMSLLGGDAVPSARKPYYGPAFGDPGGNPQVGGGNAGASLASQWSPTAQQNPRLPAGRNVAIVNPPQRAQNRASEYRCPECRAARLELAGRREQRDVGIGPGTRDRRCSCSGGSRR
jgi:hypothetical protein